MYIGIDKSVCEEIAEANNSVDYGNDCPYKNSRPHFPGGLWKSISDAKKAISRCDPNSLGRTLHIIQDFYSHVYGHPFGYNWNPPFHTTPITDYIEYNKDEIARASKMTRMLLQEYASRCGYTCK